MIYLQLLVSFIQVGLFSVGGGYAAIPLIQEQIVDVHSWMTMSQFANIVAIAEMTPGPIAIDAATLVGIHIAGIPGAVMATIGCVLPSFIIVMIFAYLYYRLRNFNIVQGILAGIRPAVVSMIASAGILLLMMAICGQSSIFIDFKTIDLLAVIIFAGGLFALRKWKASPLWVMIGSGLAGIVLYFIF